MPPAILCVGLNYKKHAAETDLEEPRFPVVFYKNPASVIGPGDTIVIPLVAADPPEMDYECELAVVIGPRPVRNVCPGEALDYVLGYTAANDVSARRWQGKRGGSQWCRSKSFDTFCPLGPHLLMAGEGVDPDKLEIATRVNGETMQSSNTSDMIFNVPHLIAFLSESTTLLPGTIILTGTPEGVGFARKPPLWLQPGDQVEIDIEGIGVLTNKLVSETPEHTKPQPVWSHALGKLIYP
jgi:2-keto-4-pentenoate hydratase/2-oxohepta-3-ene-1,7-dioic acid hydratase in catechol pathway